MRKLEEYPWWSELVALKDVLSLRELAERFDVTPGAISMALKRNDIGRESAPPGPRDRRRKKAISSEIAEILVKDTEVAEQAIERRFIVEPVVAEPAPSPDVVAAVAEPHPAEVLLPDDKGSSDLLAPFEDLLGEVPDEEIASLAGVSVKEVARVRESQEKAASDSKKTSRLAAFSHLLGKVPDRVVAEQANLSVSAVCVYRRRRGIGAYIPPIKPEEGEGFVQVPLPMEAAPAVAPAAQVVPAVVPAAPVAVTPVAPAPAPVVAAPAAPAFVVAVGPVAPATVPSSLGYMVTIGDKQYVVVGKDLLAIAEIAMAANLGLVEKIELIGPAL